MFATVLDGYNEENTLNLIKVKMTNTAKTSHNAYFTSVMRGKYPDCREGDLVGFSPDNRYEISNSMVYRDDKLIYTFPKPVKSEVVYGVDYKKPFTGKEYSIKPENRRGSRPLPNQFKNPASKPVWFLKCPKHL